MTSGMSARSLRKPTRILMCAFRFAAGAICASRNREPRSPSRRSVPLIDLGARSASASR